MPMDSLGLQTSAIAPSLPKRPGRAEHNPGCPASILADCKDSDLVRTPRFSAGLVENSCLAVAPRLKRDEQEADREEGRNSQLENQEQPGAESRISENREHELFIRLDQLRARLRQRLTDNESIVIEETAGTDTHLGEDVRSLNAAIDQVRSEIAMAFQRLAQSIASRFNGAHLSREDLGNEADVAMLVAIDRFDVSRGFRFSTYATRCITNHLVKVSKREFQHRDSTRRLVEEPFGESVAPEDFDLDPRELTAQLLDEVADRERRLISLRFGLDSEFEGMSYRQIADRCGMSAERVRQLIHDFCERARRRHAKRLGFE